MERVHAGAYQWWRGDVAAFEDAVVQEHSGAHVFNLRGDVASVEQIIATIKQQVPGATLAAEGERLPFHAELDESPLPRSLPCTSLRDGIARTLDYYRQQLPTPY